MQMKYFPNAKINIGLNIVSKRPDGYHNIETVFYPIALCDELIVQKQEKIPKNDYRNGYSLQIDGLPVLGDSENNLIIKAFNQIRSDFTLPDLNIILKKIIPMGAGLGGGSSDAAFMLKAVNDIFNLSISVSQLEKYASRIGADCAFFIQNKPCFASGIGNIFSSVDLNLKGCKILVVKPDIHVTTADAFSRVVPRIPEISLTDSIVRPVETWKALIKNDFENSVFSMFPEIADIKNELYEMGAIYASMSGSGASVYGIFSKEFNYSSGFEKDFVFFGSF